MKWPSVLKQLKSSFVRSLKQRDWVVFYRGNDVGGGPPLEGSKVIKFFLFKSKELTSESKGSD